MNSRLKTIVIIFCCLLTNFACSQFTRQDTLRGSIGAGRAWWDVKKYAIHINVNIPEQSLSGYNRISFEMVPGNETRYMQLDLQTPMEIEKVEWPGQTGGSLPFRREGNVYWVDFGETRFAGRKDHEIVVHFRGTPHKAVNPPWDGGWIWTRDEQNRPWITAACQGLGASVWYPCKDHQGDEPDKGASLSITVPDSLVAVGNGRLSGKKKNGNSHTTWEWEVTAPINNYNIIPYIGKYVNWTETFNGKNGKLDCSYWVLDYDLAAAKKQFGRDVKPMLTCFENWFGPFPFYKDGYKLVETPHLGMEHQSAVAYGNRFLNGYLGTDLSGTGWGIKWDFIIIHESGHEWFANNITTNDIADMWVHEGFTNYSEVIFVECQYGKKAADAYCQGLRQNIQNDMPVIGTYGVNKEGSGDMYAKGANLIHTIRQVINNDTVFKSILKGLNRDFYHRTVNSKDVENYMSRKSGKDLSKIFDQYLRTANIPVLEYRVANKTVSYRWGNCVPGFNMPLRISFGRNPQWIKPTENWQSLKLGTWFDGTFSPDKNFYITAKKL